MARGAESKSKVMNKILETFEGSFLYNGGKELRIPMIESGELVQVKVTLTAAKTNVEPEGEIAVATAAPKAGAESAAMPASEPKLIRPTKEEEEAVDSLLQRLGL